MNFKGDLSRNIYNKQNGVSTTEVKRNSNISAKPVSKSSNLKNNNIISDKQGNVYQKDKKGNWQQRDGNEWKPANKSTANDLNKQMQSRERSQNLNKNYNQAIRPYKPAPVKPPPVRPAPVAPKRPPGGV